MELPALIGTAATVLASIMAVVFLVWRIVVRRSKAVEDAIRAVDAKVEKLADKVDSKLQEITKALFELKGEVKGRNYAELEELMRNTRDAG